jgi:hypothetical protein
MKIRPVGAELRTSCEQTDGRKDRDDEANSRLKIAVNKLKLTLKKLASYSVVSIKFSKMSSFFTKQIFRNFQHAKKY